MSFKIGDHVEVIYGRPTFVRKWRQCEQAYIGKRGHVRSNLVAPDDRPKQKYYHVVKFDDGTEMGIAHWALRKLDDREDLQVVGWQSCQWRPKSVETSLLMHTHTKSESSGTRSCS